MGDWERAAADDGIVDGAGLRAFCDEIEGLGKQLQTVLQGSRRGGRARKPVCTQETANTNSGHRPDQGRQKLVCERPDTDARPLANRRQSMDGRGHAPAFRQSRQAPKGALFTFFERDEWQHLAGGGGRFKALIERLVPGYDEGRCARSSTKCAAARSCALDRFIIISSGKRAGMPISRRK